MLLQKYGQPDSIDNTIMNTLALPRIYSNNHRIIDIPSSAVSFASCSSPAIRNSSGFLSFNLVNSVSSLLLNSSSSI